MKRTDLPKAGLAGAKDCRGVVTGRLKLPGADTLVDSTRHEIAASLLRSTRLSITEVSVMLGYRDPSSFSRPFMRWAGCAPRRFRAAQRAGINGNQH